MHQPPTPEQIAAAIGAVLRAQAGRLDEAARSVAALDDAALLNRAAEYLAGYAAHLQAKP